MSSEAYSSNIAPQPILGIDIGNSKCVIALSHTFGPKLPVILHNNLSNDQTPNIVSFKGKERYIGEEALTQFVSTPKSTISSIKKFLGELFQSNDKFNNELKKTAFHVVEGNAQVPFIEVTYADSVHKFRPEEILSMVLTNLKHFAEDKLKAETENIKAEQSTTTTSNKETTNIPFEGFSPLKCVVSVPGSYNERQRNAIIDAASIAEIDLIGLVSESTAAALSFAASRPFGEDSTPKPERNTKEEPNSSGNVDKPVEEQPPKKILLFIEMGHRYFSCQLVEYSKNNLKVVSNAFDDALGGKDIDHALFEFAAAEFSKKYPGMNVQDHPKAMCRLLKACEKAKEVLSTVPVTELQAESLIGDRDLFIKVSRNQLEELTRPLLERVEQHILTVLNNSPYQSIEQIEFVEVIGGGLRTPFVQEKIKQVVNSFHKLAEEKTVSKELSYHLDSAHCIATGAALYGKILSSKDKSGDDYIAVEDSLSGSVDGQTSTSSDDPYRMTPSDIQNARDRNKQISANDLLITQTKSARNNIESYIYSKRDQCHSSSYSSVITNQTEKDQILSILSSTEDWLNDNHETGDLASFQSKLEELQNQVNNACPSLHQYLVQQEEERIRAAKEAEEFKKTYRPMTRDADAPRTKGEKIEAAKKRKNQGNVLFKDGDYENAVLRYSQGVAYFDQIWDLDEEQKKEVDEVKLSCYLNLSMCYLKLKNYERSRDNSSEAIKIEPNNVKALFRRGQSFYYLKDFENAKKDLIKAEELEPKNADVKKTLKVVQEQLAAQKQKEKQFYGKMFG